MQKQPSKGFFKKVDMRNFAEFTRKHLYHNPLLVFSCELSEICKNIFLAEQHWTTASSYNSINSSEECTGRRDCELWDKNIRINLTRTYVLIWDKNIRINLSQKCKLLKRAVQVKEQVSEAGVRRLQIRWSCKFHRKTSVLDSISNKVETCKISKNTFFYRGVSVAASDV